MPGLKGLGLILYQETTPCSSKLLIPTPSKMMFSIFTILFPFNSSNPVQSRLNRGSDSPNPGTSYKQLGRFTFKKKGGKIC